MLYCTRCSKSNIHEYQFFQGDDVVKIRNNFVKKLRDRLVPIVSPPTFEFLNYFFHDYFCHQNAFRIHLWVTEPF